MQIQLYAGDKLLLTPPPTRRGMLSECLGHTPDRSRHSKFGGWLDAT